MALTFSNGVVSGTDANSKTISITQDGYRPADEGGGELSHTVQNVGNFSVYYKSPELLTLKTLDGGYTGIDANGGVYLTGFKLESMIIGTEQQIDNAKLVPLVNGDSITLTNLCKAGVISFNAARTAAGVNGGDCVAIFDYVRSQGDNGATLVFKWKMNGSEHELRFAKVCVKKCPPVALAGNDVADYQVQLTYADYSDSDSPAYNSSL